MNNKELQTPSKIYKENSKNTIYKKQISSIIKENEKKYPKTVYFTIIEYIHIKNYQIIERELIVEYFKKEYELDPYGLIGSSTSKNFTSEKMLIINVKKTIKYNNSFINIIKSDKLFISLNLKNTYNNLIKIYGPIPQYGRDITSSIRNIMINDNHINDNINNNHKSEEKSINNNNPKREQKDKIMKTKKDCLIKKVNSNTNIKIKKENKDEDQINTEKNNVRIKKEDKSENEDEDEDEEDNKKLNKKNNTVYICNKKDKNINNFHMFKDHFDDKTLVNDLEFNNYNLINDEINKINKYYFQLAEIKAKLDFFQKNYILLIEKNDEYFDELKKTKDLEKEQIIIYKLILYKYKALKSFLINQFFTKSLSDKQVNDIEKNIADFEKNNEQIKEKIFFLNNSRTELLGIKRKINEGIKDIYNNINNTNLFPLFQDNLFKNNLIKNCIKDIEEIDYNNILLISFNKYLLSLQNKLDNIKLKLQNLLNYDK